MEKFTIEYATEPLFGSQLKGNSFVLNVHDKSECEGEFCGIHNPSDHPLKNAPRNWRADKGEMERICVHGVGHPDYDGVQFGKRMAEANGEDPRYIGIHGCDGCC